jgi:hypothetical protein
MAKTVFAVRLAWAERYDGNSELNGVKPPNSYGEASAFVANEKGWVQCGVGKGRVGGSAHRQIQAGGVDFLLVAKNPDTKQWEAVGVYQQASIQMTFYENDKGNCIRWAQARAPITSTIELLGENRIPIGGPPGGTAMRAYIMESGEILDRSLYAYYQSICEA